MAKQGINPIEQHVEKIVAGASALLLVFVVYTYVVSTPVTVRVGNQLITPSELDRTLAAAADQVANIYRRATFTPPPPTQDTSASALEVIRAASADLAKIPPEMASPVRWWPEIPKPDKDLGPGRSKHGLAKVGAPVITGVFSGVTYAGLVSEPVALLSTSTGGSSTLNPASASATTNQDVVWAFLRLNFDMQQQYDMFRQDNYTREQANLSLQLVMDVQAQRQRVYPDGSTGPWEDIKPYKTVQVTYPQAVTVNADGSLSRSDVQSMQALFDALIQAQQRILYPLPQILGGDPFTPYGIPSPLADSTPVPGTLTPPVRPAPLRQPAARSPRSTRGGTDRRSSGGFESDASRGGGREFGGRERFGRPGSTAGGLPSVDKQALMQANQAIMDARKAYEAGRYAEALQLLDRARGVQVVQRQVIELDAKINAAYAKWKEEEAKALADKASQEARNAEIWVYDMQAPPGRACRYRARLVLFNVFAHPDSDRREDLNNPQDGAQVALVGDWSAPSDPITLADSRHFFLINSQPDKETATVDVFRFQQGRWFKDTIRGLAVGDAIGESKAVSTAGGPVNVDYRTGYVVVDIGTDSGAVVGSDNKGAKITVRRTTSPFLVCMDADGAIEQRWAAADRVDPLSKELDLKFRTATESPAPTVSGLMR
jgi:hypothetical protein